jgi:hypothetical protein
MRAALILAASLAWTTSGRAALAETLGQHDPTRLSFDAPSEAVLVGADIGRTEWPTRLATPSAEGQFEILLRKDAAPVLSPHCSSRYLVVRMPASLESGAEAQANVERKRQQYARILSDYSKGRPIHFDVFAGPYGKRLPNGRVELSGCNMFFEPNTPPAPKPGLEGG